MSLGLPQGLNYNAQKARASARQRLISITPDSGTSFSMGQSVSFRLPTAQGQYIDTSTVQLQFSLTNNHGTKHLKCSSSGSCVIARKIERQAQVISDIGPGYNQLVEILLDTQMGAQQRVSSNAITSGNDATHARLGLSHAAGATKVYRIGLYGGLLGGASKYVPCNLSSSMVLELDLETAVRAFVWEAGTTSLTDASVTLSNLELTYNTVELPAEMDRMLLASSPVQTVMIEDFQTTTTTMAAGATAHNTVLPFNKSSMKSYFAAMFLQSQSNTPTLSCINNRARSQLTSFQVNIGGLMFPDKALTMVNNHALDHGAVFFTNALLAVGHITPNEVHHTSMLLADWKTVTSTAAADPGSFFVGVDTDSFVGVSSGVYSGKNTLNTNFSPTYQFGAGAETGGLLFRHFCCFDSVVSIDSSTGLISVSN